MNARIRSIGVASVVLLACTVAGSPVAQIKTTVTVHVEGG
jgi:hypothetical protein